MLYDISFPNAKGVYTLLVRTRSLCKVHIGRLGEHILKPGTYIYVGSALGKGSTSIKGRLSRYLSIHCHKTYWHIDWLLLHPRTSLNAIVYALCSKRMECILANAILRSGKFKIAIKHFGSSDCSCPSHLFFTKDELNVAILNLIEIYERLNLTPKIVRLK